MRTQSAVLEALAIRYERALAGRTGESSREVSVFLEDLLRQADAREGDKRALAEMQLHEAEAAGILILVPLHKRDRSYIHRVRFSPTQESKLYDLLGKASPSQTRVALSQQFALARTANLPLQWKEHWCKWCDRMSEFAVRGRSVFPFDREATAGNADLLTLLPKLLQWKGESLVRFASCVLCGDSKSLENMAGIERGGPFNGKLRGKLGRILSEITGGAIEALDDLGILPTPRFALFHGPLRLRFDDEWLDLGLLQGAFRLAQADIARAKEVKTPARRCITVENETSFHELVKLQSGELLVHTSFPGSGTLELLRRLPADLEFWHFGDSDSAGFEILRVLRERSQRDFRPLHMEQGKIPFEQESLGRPTCEAWPFYS